MAGIDHSIYVQDKIGNRLQSRRCRQSLFQFAEKITETRDPAAMQVSIVQCVDPRTHVGVAGG